jgi:TonB family protein
VVGDPPPGASAAMIAAYANRAKMKAPPRQIKRGTIDYPPAERAAGTTGRVLVRGLVLADGRFIEVAVSQSSGVPAFDAAALKAAGETLFKPATDAAGTAIAVPAVLPFRFAISAGSPVNIARYVPAPYPEGERAAGRHGKVVVGGLVGRDGKLIDPQVTLSSKSPGLDAAALAAARATDFRRDAVTAAVPTVITYEFVSFRSPGQSGGVLRYACAQFVRDQDWWKATWPAKERSEFENMMSGLGFLVLMGGNRRTVSDYKSWSDGFKVRFPKAIEDCRAKPDALAIDMLKPEGLYARRLAERGGI